MIVTEKEREAETQAEGEAGSMHREPDVGFDPGSPGSHPGPKTGTKPLRHPGIPRCFLNNTSSCTFMFDALFCIFAIFHSKITLTNIFGMVLVIDSGFNALRSCLRKQIISNDYGNY